MSAPTQIEAIQDAIRALTPAQRDVLAGWMLEEETGALPHEGTPEFVEGLDRALADAESGRTSSSADIKAILRRCASE